MIGGVIWPPVAAVDSTAPANGPVTLENETWAVSLGINLAAMNKQTSFGLLGMRERATMLGGTLNIEKLPEGGTGISIKIPLHK